MDRITFQEAKEIYNQFPEYKDWKKEVEARGKAYVPQDWFDAAEATILEKEEKEKGGH